MTKHMKKTLLNTRDMAQVLGIDEPSLTALARRQVVPSMKVGHRTILYDAFKVRAAFSRAVKAKLASAGMDTRKLKTDMSGEDLRALGIKPSMLIKSARQLASR